MFTFHATIKVPNLLVSIDKLKFVEPRSVDTALWADVAANGVLKAISIDRNLKVTDGVQRVMAAKAAGITVIPCTVVVEMAHES